MSDPKDHGEDRGLLDSILRQIPDFKNYLEKENRPQSHQLKSQWLLDRLLKATPTGLSKTSSDWSKKWLADRLLRTKPAIDRLARPLVEAAQLDALPQLDRLRARIDKVIWQIRSGMQGYSGLFDLVKVDEELLERVYQHDIALIAKVEALVEAIESLPDDSDEIVAALPSTFDAVDAIEHELEVRADMLSKKE